MLLLKLPHSLTLSAQPQLGPDSPISKSFCYGCPGSSGVAPCTRIGWGGGGQSISGNLEASGVSWWGKVFEERTPALPVWKAAAVWLHRSLPAKDSHGHPGSPHQHLASPKSGLISHPVRQQVTCGGLSAAALISTPHTGSHPALGPRQGHHGEENSLFLLHAGVHQGGDTTAGILLSSFLAARGTAAFALGDTGQPP